MVEKVILCEEIMPPYVDLEVGMVDVFTWMLGGETNMLTATKADRSAKNPVVIPSQDWKHP